MNPDPKSLETNKKNYKFLLKLKFKLFSILREAEFLWLNIIYTYLSIFPSFYHKKISDLEKCESDQIRIRNPVLHNVSSITKKFICFLCYLMSIIILEYKYELFLDPPARTFTIKKF